MSDKISKAKTVLDYTDKQLEAINALKANAGTPLTQAELGVPSIIITSIMTKTAKVDSGALSNPDNLPVLHIVKGKKMVKETVEKEVTTYCVEAE